MWSRRETNSPPPLSIIADSSPNTRQTRGRELRRWVGARQWTGSPAGRAQLQPQPPGKQNATSSIQSYSDCMCTLFGFMHLFANHGTVTLCPSFLCDDSFSLFFSPPPSHHFFLFISSRLVRLVKDMVTCYSGVAVRAHDFV